MARLQTAREKGRNIKGQIRENERRMIKKGLGKRGNNRMKTSRRGTDLKEKRGKWVSQEKKKKPESQKRGKGQEKGK